MLASSYKTQLIKKLKKMKKLAVFDWNGTLFDDLHANLAGANAALAIASLPAIDLETYQRTMLFPISDFYYHHGVTAEVFAKEHERILNAFLETYESEADECGLRDKTLDILSALVDEGYECIILSNHFMDEVMGRVQKFEIEGYFSEISCNTKGCIKGATQLNKEERLKAYIRNGNYDSSSSFIIGDSLEEPAIADRLGLRSFSVTGGCFDAQRLFKQNTEVINCFSELLPKLRAPKQLNLSPYAAPSP